MGIITHLSKIGNAILDEDNRKKIFEGIKNDIKGKFGNLTDQELEVIAERQTICHTCSYNSENAKESDDYLSLYKEHYTDGAGRPDLHCAICSCNIDWKTKSFSSDCGISFWNANHPDQQLPLKWNATLIFNDK